MLPSYNKKDIISIKNIVKSQILAAVHGAMLRKPLGAMVSSPDQTPQVPFMFFLIIHYFERPAPSVRLVKSIHLRAYCKYWLVMCVLAFPKPTENITCNFCSNSIYFTQKKQHLQVLFASHKEEPQWLAAVLSQYSLQKKKGFE